MTNQERRAFGSRVAKLRKERGLTQGELAAAIGRTASWLSQVERGIQPVNRLDVLRLLADGLGVPLPVLAPNAPPAPQSEPEAGAVPNDLDRARLLLSGHPTLSTVLTSEEPVTREALAGLRADVNRLWSLTHTDRFTELSAALTPLIPALEAASRTASTDTRAEVNALLARAYQAVAAAFVRQDEADAAWIAADRSIRAAEQSDQPLAVFAGIYRLAHAFVRLKRLDQAEHAATTAVTALEAHVTAQPDADPRSLSVLGSLHLVLALVHARAGTRTAAREHIETAREIARHLGEDRNDFGLEFGPTNVEIQAVSTAVDLGDAGEALDVGATLHAAHLSPERHARLLLDLARAHLQRRHLAEALGHLLHAEDIAPEMIRTHVTARDTIHELLVVAGRSAPLDLRELAERADAVDPVR